MIKNKYEGVCQFCMKSFASSSIGRHLVSCQVKKQEDTKNSATKKVKNTIYHIKISAYKTYWLHIEMQSTAKLSRLDEFLRDVWLECCEHLSEFTINGVSYSRSDWNDDWGDVELRSMDVPLTKVLKVKDKFEYIYDFGSTTYLEGRVFAEREGTLKETVRILARNNSPEFQCERCDAKATQICVECEEFYCGPCLEEHECGEDMALPVVNSPRMGVCAYCGDYDFDGFT